MEPTREIFWNIRFPAILYILGAIATLIFAYSIYRHYQRWRLGKPTNRFNHLGRRAWAFIVTTVVDGVLHRKFFECTDGWGHKNLKPRELYAGLAHFLIFTGCLVFLTGSFMDFINHYFLHFMDGNFYLGYSVVIDSFGILVIIGVVMEMVRRYIQKPDRLDNKWDDLTALLLILLVVLTGFIVEGLRIAATELKENPDWAIWSPGGLALAGAFNGLSEGALRASHLVLWWFHTLLSLGAIVYVSLFNNRLLHIIWDPVNVFFRKLEPAGALVPINLELAANFGTSNIEHFTWKHLLDLDACTRCGRCQDACPAYFSGKALNPKKVIQDLKTYLYEVYPGLVVKKPAESRKDMISEVITDEVIWDCTTCRACQQACPVLIEHVDKIVDMRRSLAMERSQLPETVQEALKSLGDREHPYRGTTAIRTDWAKGMEIKTFSKNSNIDLLFWVGCTGALDARNMKVSAAMAKILQAAGINFGILGTEAACCGDPARRMGDEYLFQTLCQ